MWPTIGATLKRSAWTSAADVTAGCSKASFIFALGARAGAAPEGCQRGTHENGTAYPLPTHKVLTQVHTHEHKPHGLKGLTPRAKAITPQTRQRRNSRRQQLEQLLPMPPTNHRTQPDHCSSGAGSTVGNRSSAPGRSISAPGRSDAIEPTLIPQPDSTRLGMGSIPPCFSRLSHITYLILRVTAQHTGSDSASIVAFGTNRNPGTEFGTVETRQRDTHAGCLAKG